MAESNIIKNPNVVMLAEFTAANQSKDFAENVNNFSICIAYMYYNEFYLGSTTWFPKIESPAYVIISFHDGTVRKFQMGINGGGTYGSSAYFTNITKAKIVGIR